GTGNQGGQHDCCSKSQNDGRNLSSACKKFVIHSPTFFLLRMSIVWYQAVTGGREAPTKMRLSYDAPIEIERPFLAFLENNGCMEIQRASDITWTSEIPAFQLPILPPVVFFYVPRRKPIVFHVNDNLNIFFVQARCSGISIRGILFLHR